MGGDYNGSEYWDNRYTERGDEIFQWLQSENDIEHLVQDFFSYFGVHPMMSRVVELGYGSSTMAHNVLYKSNRYGPEYAKALAVADVAMDDDRQTDTVTAKGMDPERSVVSVDYSKVAYQIMLERLQYTSDPESHPGLYYVAANAYDFLEILGDNVTNPKEEMELYPIADKRLDGYWLRQRRPVDFMFDSSTWDTLILQNVREAKEGQATLFNAMNKNHGAWLSVSYNEPKTRLRIYQSQPWDRIIICKPAEGKNHLFWLLRGKIYTEREFPKGVVMGKNGYYTCSDATEFQEEPFFRTVALQSSCTCQDFQEEPEKMSKHGDNETSLVEADEGAIANALIAPKRGGPTVVAI